MQMAKNRTAGQRGGQVIQEEHGQRSEGKSSTSTNLVALECDT